MNIGDPVLRHCPSQSRRELAMVFGMNYAGGQRGPEALALSLWMTPQAQHHRGFLGVKTYTATQAGMGVGVTWAGPGEAAGEGRGQTAPTLCPLCLSLMVHQKGKGEETEDAGCEHFPASPPPILVSQVPYDYSSFLLMMVRLPPHRLY